MPKADLVRTPPQKEFDLQIAKEVEIDGVGMGVLSDGTPYLTLRGLARMCGVVENSVRGIVNAWNEDALPPRVSRIKSALKDQGFNSRLPYTAIQVDGSTHYACPDLVCMAFLEYYAFDAKPTSQHAIDNYRLLARTKFRDFIYARVGYDPNAAKTLAWDQFHERIDLVYDSVPDGYFSIFRETASVQLAMIREGACPSQKFIPDGSIGGLFGKEWRDRRLGQRFGERREYDHYYPDGYNQSKSNPQPAWAYPDTVRAYFRQWLRDVYSNKPLSNYMQRKIKDGGITAPVATAAVAAIRRGIAAPPPVRQISRR